MTKTYKQIPSSTDGPLDDNFGKLVNETLELWHVPGLSIAVVDGDKTWAKVTLVSKSLLVTCAFCNVFRSRDHTYEMVRAMALPPFIQRLSRHLHYFTPVARRRLSLLQFCHS